MWMLQSFWNDIIFSDKGLVLIEILENGIIWQIFDVIDIYDDIYLDIWMIFGDSLHLQSSNDQWPTFTI